jgi:hypothetical protein
VLFAVLQIKEACEAEGLVFAYLQFMFLNIHESFSYRREQYSGGLLGYVDFILFVMLMLGQQLFPDPASHSVSKSKLPQFRMVRRYVDGLKESYCRKNTSVKLEELTNK